MYTYIYTYISIYIYMYIYARTCTYSGLSTRRKVTPLDDGYVGREMPAPPPPMSEERELPQELNFGFSLVIMEKKMEATIVFRV